MSGVTTVKDLLLEHPPYTLYTSISNPSLSKKKWTDTFHSIPNPTIHPPTLDGVNEFLASDQYTPNTNTVYTADYTDINRLGRAVYRLNYLDRVDVQTEGDVERDFHQNIALPVSLAWQKNGQFLQRSLSGPPGPTNTDKTVDHLYSWQVEGVAANERCQVIGEMKQHGVIRVDEWEGRKPKTPTTVRLGREIRGYAFEYKCPQVFVYDGKHLLIVQFKAKDRDNIKSAHCAIDCCVLARTREFRFWSGRPYWVYQNMKVMDHPDGYMRRLGQDRWYWVDGQGNNVMDENGANIWDTVQFFSIATLLPSDSSKNMVEWFSDEVHGPLKFLMGHRLVTATIAERIDPRQTVYRLKLEKPSILDFIPILCIRWIFACLFNLWPKLKTFYPEWFLPPTVILKKRKPDWNEEFEVEKLMYRRLQPLQGKFIPCLYGEATYDGSPTLDLSEIVGRRLFDFTMKPGEDEEFERKLEEAYKALTTYGVTHEDPKLDNAIDIGDRVMIIDLEQCIIEDTNWEESMNKASVGYLMDSLQLKRQYEDEARQREEERLKERRRQR